MSDDFELRFRKTFSVVAFICNRHIVDHMRRIGPGIGVGMESAMLWGLVAHLNMARSITPGAPPGDVMNVQGEFTGELHPVRLADIMQVASMPKETVRRKLEELRALGKLDRVADGRWVVLASGVDEATYQFTLETARRLLATAKQIEALLAQAAPE